MIDFFVFFCNSVANLHSAIVTLCLPNICSPVQDNGLKASCSIDTGHLWLSQGHAPNLTPDGYVWEALLCVT